MLKIYFFYTQMKMNACVMFALMEEHVSTRLVGTYVTARQGGLALTVAEVSVNQTNSF